MTIGDKIKEATKDLDLIWDELHYPPVKIGPDVMLIYVTERTEECRKNGDCKLTPYYALVGGDSVILRRNRQDKYKEYIDG